MAGVKALQGNESHGFPQAKTADSAGAPVLKVQGRTETLLPLAAVSGLPLTRIRSRAPDPLTQLGLGPLTWPGGVGITRIHFRARDTLSRLGLTPITSPRGARLTRIRSRAPDPLTRLGLGPHPLAAVADRLALLPAVELRRMAGVRSRRQLIEAAADRGGS